jgi:hypothetical protein
VATDPATFCRALAYASGILGVPWPEVYLFPESPGEIDLANARETVGSIPTPIPAFVVGRNALEGRTEMELAFIVGRNLAMMRPDAFVRWPTVVPTLAELEVVVRAAIALVIPDAPAPPPEHAAAVAQYLEFLTKVLAPQLVEQLSHVCRRLLAAGATLDVGRWSRGVALSGIRAGLLICGDLEVASRLGEAPAAAAGIDAAALIRDLAEWNVSDEYFTLRDQLGLVAVNLETALR